MIHDISRYCSNHATGRKKITVMNLLIFKLSSFKLQIVLMYIFENYELSIVLDVITEYIL